MSVDCQSKEFVFFLFITSLESGRYAILQTGELLIQNASFSDSGFYRCQIHHRLTDELRTSEEPGRLIVTEPHNSVAPRIWTHGAVTCEPRQTCELICVAQSWPLSTYRWYRETESGIYMDASLYQTEIRGNGQILVIRSVNILQHSGQWICVANNSVGEEKVSIRLLVNEPLSVQIEPRKAQIDAGRSLTINCSSNGDPPIRPPMWFYNGKSMINIFREHVRDQRIRLIESNLLHIAAVRRQDIGAYQCVIQSENDEAQATMELKLGDVAPLMLENFKEKQIVEPGNTVSLRCVVIGTPLPQIRWLLDGQPIPNLSRFRSGDHVTSEGKVVSFVNITNVRVVDGGQFSCLAENEVGKVLFNGLVLVNGGPTLRTTFYGHHNQSVVAGQNTIIRCPVIGYPIESIVWEHDSNILPANHRQSIDPIIDGYGGTLRINNVHSFQDSGEYVCSIRIPNGDVSRSPRGKIIMNVHYAPKIDRHSLPNHLQTKQGDRIKLMCSVIEGDQPIQIEWLRNNKIIKSSDQISIQNGDDYSLLTFKNVLITDSDKWTCQARNSYAIDNSTVEIVVNVPPKWVHEPKNSEVILSRSLTLNCQAEGFPKPKIVWKKATNSMTSLMMATNQNENFNYEKIKSLSSYSENNGGGNQNNDFRDILSSYRYQVFSNGSLFLQETEITDSGLYMCQISNGVGVDLSKVIQIQVRQPPRVETKFSTETVIKGSNATIRCRSEGDPILSAEWKRDMQPIESKQIGGRYIIKEDSIDDRDNLISYLEILDTRRLDSALFTCTISNNYGSDICNVQLIIQEVPEPPRDVGINEITSRSIKIKWKPSFAGNSAIVGFIVQYQSRCFDENSVNENQIVDKRNSQHYIQLEQRKFSGRSDELIVPLWKELYINDPNAQSYILRELYPWCEYELRMRAKNSIGLSDPSQMVLFRTAEEMPGGPPLDVSVEPISSNSLKIKWRPPDKFLQFGQIKGYYIGYRIIDTISSNGNSNNIKTKKTSNDQNHFMNVEGPTEQYAYKNVEVNLVESNVYEVAYLTNLKKNTIYAVVVQAFNAAGAGPRSDEITLRTLNVPRSNAIVLEVVSVETDSITLRWDIDDESEFQSYPSSSHSSSSTSSSSSATIRSKNFVLHISEEGSGKWLEKKLPYQMRRHIENNLKCGTKYLMYMTYDNSPIATSTGEIITTRTKGTVAISPTTEEFLKINETAVTLNFESWQNGGCPIQNFSIKYRHLYQKHWKIIGVVPYDYGQLQAKPYSINSLEPDQFYLLSVIASSAAGMTEAIYNFSTTNTTTMVFRLSPPDLASFEYTSNAPFHNVTIMLPIIISVIVLIAVLATLIAFIKKQELLREQRECISNSSQSLHLRSSSIRSKNDITETVAYPMVDYAHAVCHTPQSSAKIADVNNSYVANSLPIQTSVALGHCGLNALDGIYSKTYQANNPNLMYSPSKRIVLCDNTDQQTSNELVQYPKQSQRIDQFIKSSNGHHIYAEPNPSSSSPSILHHQGYAQPRCLVSDLLVNNAANVPLTTSNLSTETGNIQNLINGNANANNLITTINNVNSDENFCALVNTSTHL
ncbi:Down syndrome cell adhesion molecule -like protein [Sarcoptes scabiei]|uniref:Down syndrome cell adhesion molecule -like protein n=1 Tax=Sarcoptes scabiei TaxID=52283 RepID=A0A834VDE7_SARSC|nr:Down syndrome cell adhesion molecule -like protein [Sarcoptes scabiei]